MVLLALENLHQSLASTPKLYQFPGCRGACTLTRNENCYVEAADTCNDPAGRQL